MYVYIQHTSNITHIKMVAFLHLEIYRCYRFEGEEEKIYEKVWKEGRRKRCNFIILSKEH